LSPFKKKTPNREESGGKEKGKEGRKGVLTIWSYGLSGTTGFHELDRATQTFEQERRNGGAVNQRLPMQGDAESCV